MTAGVLLLVERRGNRGQLAAWVERTPGLSLVEPDEGIPPDLVVVDGPGFARHRGQLDDARRRAHPAFLPCLLVLPQRDAGRVREELWQTVDDVVTTPIRPPELLVRVQRQLAARRLSLETATRARELQRSNTDLERFAFVAAHELRSPLAVVSGFVETLSVRHRETLTPGAAVLLDEALRGCRRMGAVVDDVLAYSRVHRHVRSEAVDCGRIVGEALAELAREVEESDADVRVEGLPEVTGDPTLLRLVFRNLLANAIKFRRPGTAPAIEVTGGLDGTCWLFCVSDDGIGIPADDASRVFEIFERGRSGDGYAGSGIGLATCRRIVEQHGGTIWCVPGERSGAVIRFTIPA